MMQNKPFSIACEKNQQPILSELQKLLEGNEKVLEIGSGTGQHAVYFAGAMPDISWQTSDLKNNHAGIQAWLDEAKLDNVFAPLELDVTKDQWPSGKYDVVYSANTFHIMSWQSVVSFIEKLPLVLHSGGKFVVYGPFNYDGEYTSEGNRSFDEKLRAESSVMGLRDVSSVVALAAGVGMRLLEDVGMPANNRLLVFAA